jgi:hypothetical protein
MPPQTHTYQIKLQKNVIFSILNGYENWSLTLNEEHMSSVFQRKVLMSIFRPKRDEVTGEWREICNEEMNDLYSSPTTMIKLKRILWVWL